MNEFAPSAKNSGSRNLRIVLDSNEFIFALGVPSRDSCCVLLAHLIDTAPLHDVRIPRTVVQEVLRHLATEASHGFFRIMRLLGQIDEDTVVPFEFGNKYELRGFKPADAFIAAYVEWVGAQVLITENRHFLTRQDDLAFQVLTAQAFLDHWANRPSQQS